MKIKDHFNPANDGTLCLKTPIGFAYRRFTFREFLNADSVILDGIDFVNLT